MNIFSKWVFLVLLISNSISSESSYAAKKEGRPEGIHWETGATDKAIAQIGKNGKPTFLYWGAVWCPPCNRLKKEVFAQTAIQNKLNQYYTSIYLDGDSKEAPLWGEKFKTQGYPTLIFLNQEGKEVYRLSYLTTKETFAKILDLGIHNKGIMDIIDLKTPSYGTDDYFNLANYSWTQDEDFMKRGDRWQLLQKIYKNVNKEGLSFKSELIFNYLSVLAESIKEKGQWAKLVSEKDQKEILQYLQDLKNPLLQANGEIVARMMSLILESFTIKKDKDFIAFKENYLQHAKETALANKHALAVRIRAFKLWQDLAKDGNEHFAFSDNILKSIKEMAMNADRQIKDRKERTAHFSHLVDLLAEVGLLQEAVSLAQKEANAKNNPVNPYYYLSVLADIFAKENKKEKSLDYARKAWLSTLDMAGEATQIQWGASYLKEAAAMLKEQAEGEKRQQGMMDFVKDSEMFIKMVIDNPLAFKGRNKRFVEKFLQQVDDLKAKDLQQKIGHLCEGKKNENCHKILGYL